MAPPLFKRSLFGYRRADVDDALAAREIALAEQTMRAGAEMARAERLVARISEEERRADHAVMRAGELERASLDLAGRLNGLEQVANRLAQRVVERERDIASLSERLDAALEVAREIEGIGDEERGQGADGSGDEAADIFKGLIEVEVGPLSDFSQLASFEDAAGEIGGANADLGQTVYGRQGDARDGSVRAGGALDSARRVRAVRVHGEGHARGPRRPRRGFRSRLKGTLPATVAINWAADYELARGCSSAGRASGWQPLGRGFESPQLHSPPNTESCVGSQGLRRRLGHLTHRAAAGETFNVARRGKPFCRLTPPEALRDNEGGEIDQPDRSPEYE